MRNHDILKKIRKGDIITAELLTAITDAVNKNTASIRGPVQKDIAAGSTGSGETIGNEVFNSTSVTETTIVSTDSNGDTADIERVDSVVFEEATSGRTITLNITYS